MMTAQCILPTELICQIFYHTNPPDIIRWRTVSKWFRDITYDPLLWKSLYADADFPRPPGPLPSQSNVSLERNLIKSARLAQSWTTRPMRDVSCVRIKLEGESILHGPPKLIHGRWLGACELNRRFVLHDIETGARHVVWEQDKPEVSSWDVCSMTSPEGQCVAYVLLKPEYRPVGLPGWKLLEVRLNDGSGELVDSTVIDGPGDTSFGYRQEYVKLRARKSPFLSIPTTWRPLVFDTRTRAFYKCPRFRIALDETSRYYIDRHISRGSEPMETRIAFADTCIVSLSYFCNLTVEPPTVVQVFTLSPDGSTVKNDNRVLCLTHEGILDGFQSPNIEFLKPLVDPVTGATRLRLLDCKLGFGRDPPSQVTRIDLTLPKPCADKVSPMTVEMREYRLLKRDEPKTRHKPCFHYVDVSEEGIVRGFYRGIPRRHFEDVETDHIMKFTIDTRQDEWVIDCGKLSPAEWSHLGDTWLLDESIMFDGMRGKICFADYKNTVVVDIE